MKITVQQGDLTKLKVDAIVNPANSQGLMGGGVAFFLALSGAKLGERLAALLGNKESQDFVDRQ